MSRGAALVLAGSVVLAATLLGQQSAVRASESLSDPPLLTTDRRIAASLERIAKGSTLWRDEVGALRDSGRQALILTPDQVVVVGTKATDSSEAFDRTVLAEVSPVVAAGDAISAVLVVVNLPLLEEVHSRRRSLPAERDVDLDTILIHEVYGHALPYLRAGALSGRCPDPSAGERPASACSIVRENAVRAELGLGRRTDYSLNSLFLSLEPDTKSTSIALSVRQPRSTSAPIR